MRYSFKIDNLSVEERHLPVPVPVIFPINQASTKLVKEDFDVVGNSKGIEYPKEDEI
jgi:hypothetical protein